MNSSKHPSSATEAKHDVLYGVETTKAINNFTLSDIKMPRAFLCALGLIKSASAQANNELGTLDAEQATAIQQAAMFVASGKYD